MLKAMSPSPSEKITEPHPPAIKLEAQADEYVSERVFK
jgi:hypothetical protein